LKEYRALVTGSNGFIGSQLIAALGKDFNLEVQGFDAKGIPVDKLANETLKVLEGFEPNTVFHVGANSDTLASDLETVFLQNVLATDLIAEWALRNNSKLIYSSSAACYGVSGGHPANLYGWSKYCGEKIVTAKGGVALRYFNVYGPGENQKGKMASFLYQYHKSVLLGTPISLFPGNPSRDFIHVNDVVSANLTAQLNYREAAGQVFDVGTGTATPFESMIQFFNLDIQYHKPEKIPQGYQFFTQASRQRFLPGWSPAIPALEGARQYIDYLQKHYSETIKES